jgi:toxin ParE1/3/4
MPNDYKLTLAAKNDIKDIWQYTVEKWGEQQAEKYIDQLEKKFKDLVKTPNLGRARPDIRNGYRSLPEGKHIIFYRVADHLIEIIGIPHANMDIETHFLPQTED